MINLLYEPLTYEFMRRALLAAALTGAIASVVGVYIVLRGMAFLGGGLSHAVLPGAAIAYLLQRPISIGAFLAGLLTAAGIGLVGRHPDLKQDTAIGILMSGMFALGIAIVSTIKSYSVDLTSFLFGNVLAVSSSDLWAMIGSGLLVLVALWFFHRCWVILSFDPTYASAVGLPVRLLDYGLMVLLSLVIVISMKVVGVIQILAMLVTPPATARLLTTRLPSMMWLSSLLGAFAAIVGLYLSYYLDIAAGAAIVLISVSLFLIIFLTSPRRIKQEC